MKREKGRANERKGNESRVEEMGATEWKGKKAKLNLRREGKVKKKLSKNRDKNGR